jgi:hypothetical protein
MRDDLRQLAAILALVAAGGPLAACGSASRAKPATGGATRSGAHKGTAPGAGAGANRRSLDRKQALAFAHAVNLTAVDLPGFRASPKHHEHETAVERRLQQEMLRCTGGTAGEHASIEEGSGSFERAAGPLKMNVSSEVSVARAPAMAARELMGVRSARVRGCVSRYLEALLKASSVHGAVGPVSIAHGEPPAPGTTGTFGWRISLAITVRGIRVPFYMDILGFVYGPAEVTLMSSSVLVPFPAAAQQQLFSLLVRRAQSRGA